MDYYTENEPKGEFVIVIAGADANALKQEEIESWESISVEEHVNMYVAKGMSEKDAMKQAAKDRGVAKRDIYSLLKGKGTD